MEGVILGWKIELLGSSFGAPVYVIRARTDGSFMIGNMERMGKAYKSRKRAEAIVAQVNAYGAMSARLIEVKAPANVVPFKAGGGNRA